MPRRSSRSTTAGSRSPRRRCCAQRLREADASFRVVKNSLTERAADQAGAEQLRPLLPGPTALTFVRGDAAAAAKAVADLARTTQLLAFKGGVMDGAALSSADVAAISRLPSRDVLYGQLVGLVATPITQLARTLNALVGGLAIGLSGVLAKKESGEISSPPSAASEIPAAAQTVEDSAEVDGAGGAETVEASEDGDGAAAAAAVEDASRRGGCGGCSGCCGGRRGSAGRRGRAGRGGCGGCSGCAEGAAEAPVAEDASATTPDPGDVTRPAGDPVASGLATETEDGSAPAASGDDEKEDQ